MWLSTCIASTKTYSDVTDTTGTSVMKTWKNCVTSCARQYLFVFSNFAHFSFFFTHSKVVTEISCKRNQFICLVLSYFFFLFCLHLWLLFFCFVFYSPESLEVLMPADKFSEILKGNEINTLQLAT